MDDAGAGTGLGGYLHALRLAKGASLEDMARATKISAHQLDALESEQLQELPAPIFVKGFIRAYCRFLGEPPDRAIELYSTLGGPAITTPAPRLRAARPRSSWISHPIAVSSALVVVFGLGLLALNRGVLRGPRPEVPATVPAATSAAPVAVTEPAPPAPSASPQATVSPAPPPSVATPSVPPAEPSAQRAAGNAHPRMQHLVVMAVEPTWIRVEMDGDRVAQELLPAGARREWSAADRFVLTVGNAGGITLELNGHALPALGPKGAVVRQLSITGPKGGS